MKTLTRMIISAAQGFALGVIISAMIIAFGIMIGALDTANSATRTYRPCAYEDSVGCIWDARHMGNGTGQSFHISRAGKITYLPHHIAHALLHR